MARRRTVRVPASSANLGPGFDAFACALELHCEIEVEETGTFSVETDLAIATDSRNLAVRGFAKLADPTVCRFRITSSIPLSGGLGTSAAAYVAGLLAADSMYELDADILGLATELEGHPDNVAAAVLGGFVICGEGSPARFDPPAELEAVLVVPGQAVRTREARAALPAQVPMADATYNVAAASMLTLGLATGDLDLIARGLGDRLHQPYRAHLYPKSAELVTAARDFGALGATISGAGPTVLVWCHYESTASVVPALRERAEGWAEVVRAPFAISGADVIGL